MITLVPIERRPAWLTVPLAWMIRHRWPIRISNCLWVGHMNTNVTLNGKPSADRVYAAASVFGFGCLWCFATEQVWQSGPNQSKGIYNVVIRNPDGTTKRIRRWGRVNVFEEKR